MGNTLGNILIKLFGYRAAIFFGDTAVFDRYRWLKKHLQGGPLRTLDAGCGSGAFTMYAAKIGNEAVGVSFNERSNNKAKERAKILKISDISFVQGNLGKLDKMSKALGKFDQIICFETIEHILDDKKLIKDFSSLLNLGGKLLLTTPYLHYDKHLLGDDKFELSKHEDGGHVRWGYTHKEMRKLLGNNGFNVEIETYITGYISQLLIVLDRVIYKILSKLRIHSRLALLVIFPLQMLQFLDPLLMKIIRHPFLCIGVVATKT